MMKTLISKDGTRLAAHSNGEGMPLVLVQGTGAARPDAWPAFPALAAQFEVTTFDRRGRGKSGDSPDYELAREFEDVAAVVDAVANASGEPVNLLGHSFGGLLALEAALLTDNVRKLVLYEPAVSVPGYRHFGQPFIDRIQALLDAGDRAGVLEASYRGAGMTEEEIGQLKASPAWSERLAAAHTIPREARSGKRYSFHAQRFQDLTVPVLLLLGADSEAMFKASIEVVHAALPDSRIALLQNQDHVAMYVAPALFVREVVGFLYGS
jgi:pimeloyl-ACP methyl ester carboxylesterase